MYGASRHLHESHLPISEGLREVVEGGQYTLVLEFSSVFEFSKWEDRQAKFQVMESCDTEP